MINIKLPKNLTVEKVIDLRKQFWKLYDEDSKTKSIFNKDIKKFNEIIFSEEVGIPKGTKPKEIGIILEQWYETLTQTPEYQADQTESPEYKEQTQTTLSEKELEELEKESIALETKRKDAISKSDEKLKVALEKKIKIAEEKRKIQKIKEEESSKQKTIEDLKIERKDSTKQVVSEENFVREIDKIKKIVVVPTEEIHTVTLTGEEKEKLYNLKQAVNNDPATVQKIIEEKITQSIKISSDPQIIKSVTPEIISKTAFSITENISAFPNYKSASEIPTILPVMNPVSPLVAISNINDEKLKKLIPNYETLKEFIDSSQTLAIALDTERSVNIAGANTVLESENITSIFYGDDNITQFQVSERQEEQRDEGIEIDPQEIYKQGKEINSIWKNIINKTTTTGEIVSVPSTIITSYIPTTNTALAVKSTSFILKALPFAGAAYGFKQGVLLSQWAKSGISLQKFLTTGNQSIMKMLMSGTGIQNVVSSSSWILSKPFYLPIGKFGISFQVGKNISTGIQVARGGIEFGTKFLDIAAIKGGTQTVVGTISSQAGAKVAVGASGFLTKALTFLSGLGSLATAGISLVVGWVLGKIIEKINWKKVKENFLPAVAIGGGLLIGGPIGLGLLGVGGFIAFNTIRKGIGLAGFFAKIGGIFGGIAIAIATPVIITLLIIPPTIAFFMFIINSGAYIVPQGGFGQIPRGGNLTKCDQEITGKEITHQLASSIKSGSVRFLPMTLGSRQQGVCMDPTMIILHTSAGIDNDQGNDATYGTLMQNNVSCQMATDTNDTIFMLSFFEKQVEFSWCADNLNTGGISTEMAGESPLEGRNKYSICGTDVDLIYTPDGPHPCPPLEDLSFDAICKVMQQYKIPWTQIFQHEASNGSHTDPVGDEWVDKFILRLKNNCKI